MASKVCAWARGWIFCALSDSLDKDNLLIFGPTLPNFLVLLLLLLIMLFLEVIAVLTTLRLDGVSGKNFRVERSPSSTDCDNFKEYLLLTEICEADDNFLFSCSSLANLASKLSLLI